MINPNTVKHTYVQFKDLRTMRSEYAPAYIVRGRVFPARTTRYKTATAALAHSRMFLAAWQERYDARQAQEATA